MADSANIKFCREYLKLTHASIKEAFPHINLREDAWVWCAGRDLWEFNGPEKFYWCGRANNAYEARAKGWEAWFRRHRGGGLPS